MMLFKSMADRGEWHMEELIAALDQAFCDYWTDLENYEKKRKPTDGLFGFGTPLQNDPCHDRLDRCLEQRVEDICRMKPSAEEAERAVRILLSQNTAHDWPIAAQWMLRAAERHSLPLIPFLKPEAAGAFLRLYADEYKPWDRLPVQNQVYQKLKQQKRAQTSV